MSTTLQEYLVGLGFQIDEGSYNRFVGALAQTSSVTAKLGTEVVGVGLALTGMVDQVARHFEDLYYIAQRNSSTVTGLDAMSFGFHQIGMSSQEAMGMVEAFGHSIRTNPGLQGLLRGMGVNDTDPQKAAEGLVDRLKHQFGEGGYFAAAQVANMFGIDEKTFRNLWINLDRLKAEEKDHRQRMRLAGLDADEEARHFVEFTRVLNRVEDNFSILGQRIAEDWRQPVQGMLESVDKLVAGFSRADKASDGLLGRITGLLMAFGGASALMALLGRVFGFSVPTIAPLAGAAAAVGAIHEHEHENDTGRPTNQDELDKLPWWRQLAISFGQFAFGMDPNQFLKGGNYGPDSPRVKGAPRLYTAPDYPAGTFPRPPDSPVSAVIPNRVRPVAAPGLRRTPPDEPAVAPDRVPVLSSKRVWGDDEAERAGLYEPAGGSPPREGRSGGGRSEQRQNITINQTNHINESAYPKATASEITSAHRELGDALRNMSQKTQ